MVSLWPWRNDSSSTASFEKTLSALSTKIKETQSRLDRVRASSRRSKVLSTLYLAFAYLVYAIVLLLVVGHRNMGAYEWTGLAGGPVIIYGVRITLASYFSFRIDGLESRLKEYQEERTETIQKLKDATKYDSTMELIEKYGGVEGKPGQSKKKAGPADAASPNSGPEGEKQADGERKGNTPGRTSLPPPPTANIQRRPVTPNQSGNLEPTAEFAPNAEHLPQSPPRLTRSIPSSTLRSNSQSPTGTIASSTSSWARTRPPQRTASSCCAPTADSSTGRRPQVSSPFPKSAAGAAWAATGRTARSRTRGPASCGRSSTSRPRRSSGRVKSARTTMANRPLLASPTARRRLSRSDGEGRSRL
uniref:Endoplasmic reticulum junction formation protein lunapark n=1 Tax=Bionectria ochroleuca TaxID=29856 RepID=A0A8H7N4P8_BIOOC